VAQPTTDIEDNDLDDLDDNFDDFNPDDESTPLRVGKAEVVAQLNETSGLSSASVGSRGKKRKLASPVIQVPRSSPPAEPSPVPDAADAADTADAADVVDNGDVEQSQRSSSPSLPDNISQTQEDAEVQELENPDILSETMAPPRSSSPVDDIENSTPDTTRDKRRRGRRSTNAEEDNGRGRQVKATRKQTAKPQAISTAKLQSLLPRRRRQVARERDVYDIESDDTPITSLDSDQDELAPGIASKSKKKTLRTAKKPAMPAGGKKKGTRTYTRRASSDKENGSTLLSNEDQSAEKSIVANNPKLAAIAKKFEDVDAWEMQFESVDVGGDSSSPWR
jgi:hypothetical protein